MLRKPALLTPTFPSPDLVQTNPEGIGMRCHGSGFGGRHMTSSVRRFTLVLRLARPRCAARCGVPRWTGDHAGQAAAAARRPGRSRLVWGVVAAWVLTSTRRGPPMWWHQRAAQPGRPADLPGLSDADATAASAFLSGGLEPAAARQRYEADIAQAASRLEAPRRAGGPSGCRGRDLARCPRACPSTPARWGPRGPTTGSACRSARPTCGRPPALMRGTLLPAASDISARRKRSC